MFARGLSEFGAVIIVAYHPMITPVLIYERFGAFGLKYARPVSVVFILVCLVFFIFLRTLSKDKDSTNVQKKITFFDSLSVLSGDIATNGRIKLN